MAPRSPIAPSTPVSRRGFLAGGALSLAAIAACARSTPIPQALARPPEPVWEPSRTFAFFVGLIEFADPSAYASFDLPDRKDRELFQRLIARGVPASQALFLDGRDATRDAIEARLAATLARTRPGDLLWLHYSGHGTRDDDGRGYFAPYDAHDDEATCWSVRSIVDAIERGHRGERAILSADCCHSGTLAREAARRATAGGRVGYGCLTSSLAKEASTGAWTFTECLLSAVSGAPELDLDDDDALRFDEVGRYCEAELAFVDGQLTQTLTTKGFPPRLSLSARGERGARRERVEVRGEDDEWSRAHLLAREPGRLRVRLVPDDDDADGEPRWVEPDEVRAWTPTTYERGTIVEVAPEEADEGEGDGEGDGENENAERDARARAARVLDARLGVHLVRYEDDAQGGEDEWLPAWRLSARE